MYSNPDKTVLLPNAVPTNFCNYNFTYYYIGILYFTDYYLFL